MAEFADKLTAGLPERPPNAPERKGKGKTPMHYSDVPTALDGLVERAKRGDAGSVLTGWPEIDRGLDQPVLPGEIVMLAARTGVGKTWGINTILERALRRDPEMHVLLASLEMTDVQIAQRLAAHALDMKPRDVWDDMSNGLIRPEDVMNLAPELERMLILDSSLPVSRLGEAIEHATTHFDAQPGVVAVDYFGLLGWDGRGGASRYERTSENATMLKEVVKQYDVVLLMAVQLNREGGAAGDKEPTLSSLRDSGVAEESADRIIALWRPETDDEDGGRVLTGADVECKIIKNRFGPLGAQATLTYTESLILNEGSAPRPSKYAVKDRPKWWD